MLPRMARGALWLLLLAGCRPTPPGVLVGESAHFRLYVDPALAPVPADLDGENGLVALETQWADVRTLLEMPEGKIDYWWLATENIHEACGGDIPQSGCTREDTLEVIAPTLPHAHELNHAYMFLRSHRRVVPFLAEGIAEAIGCTSENASVVRDDIAWPAVVAALPSLDVQDEGARFVKHLIRTRGIEAFLRYYEQSPERRDPALFAANFESFWGISLDDAWTAIHTVTTRGSHPGREDLPVLVAGAPDGRTGTERRGPRALLDSARGGRRRITRADSAGGQLRHRPGLRGRPAGHQSQGSPGAVPVGNPSLRPAPLAQRDTRGVHHGGLRTSRPLPASLRFSGWDGIPVGQCPKTRDGIGDRTRENRGPVCCARATRALRAICDSCAFDTCPAPPIASVIAVQGTFYGRMELFGSPGDASEVLTGSFGIGP